MNPILQRLGQTKQNGIMDIMNLMKGDPNMLFNKMMQSNPQFAQFVDENKGKSPEQIANHYGINLAKIGQYLR